MGEGQFLFGFSPNTPIPGTTYNGLWVPVQVDLNGVVQVNDIMAGHRVVLETSINDTAPDPDELTLLGGEEIEDLYAGCSLLMTSGDRAGESHLVHQYVGNLHKCIFLKRDRFDEVPSAERVQNGDTCVLISGPKAVPNMHAILNNLWETEQSKPFLKSTHGTITTDGNVQTVWTIENPQGVFKPLAVAIDFTNQTAAETIQIITYYRIVPGGGFIQHDLLPIVGVPASLLVSVNLKDLPNRYGVRVTMQRTAGGAFNYDWTAFWE